MTTWPRPVLYGRRVHASGRVLHDIEVLGDRPYLMGSPYTRVGFRGSLIVGPILRSVLFVGAKLPQLGSAELQRRHEGLGHIRSLGNPDLQQYDWSCRPGSVRRSTFKVRREEPFHRQVQLPVQLRVNTEQMRPTLLHKH